VRLSLARLQSSVVAYGGSLGEAESIPPSLCHAATISEPPALRSVHDDFKTPQKLEFDRWRTV
jgi:hypothetical protein